MKAIAGSKAMVEVRGLSVSYGGPFVLNDLAFSIASHSVTAVLGPNGSGKTTLIKTLLGIIKPQSGSVRMAAHTAYVPQGDRSRLDFPVTALDVALMGLYGQVPWWRRLGKEMRERAMESLIRVGLDRQAGKQYGKLSGGQRQRALLARAITQDADIYLLDEPFASVDPKSATLIESLLVELGREGRTVIVTSHDVGQARSWDLVLCLNRHQVAFGPPGPTLTQDVLERTYGSELIVLDKGLGTQAVTVQHHHHD